MTTTEPTASAGLAPLELPRRSTRAASAAAFRALLLRDLVVLRKNLREFIPRTILQPLLLVFVFTYVFPKIGQGVGGSGSGEALFSTMPWAASCSPRWAIGRFNQSSASRVMGECRRLPLIHREDGVDFDRRAKR